MKAKHLRALVLLTTLALPILACSDDSPTEPVGGPVAFKSVFTSDFTGFGASEQRVILSQTDWAAVWATLHRDVSPVPPLPEVDFDQEILILAALGSRSNTCFQVDVSSIQDSSGVLEVEVTESTPGPGCICGAAITQPAQVVRLERVAEGARFTVGQARLSC